MQLRDNTVLITGGASGIGLAFAKKLLALGNRVIVCGRHREKLDAAARALPGLAALRCDITVRSEVAALVDTIKTTYPKLNLLINNAGIQLNYRFTDGTDRSDDIDAEMEANFTSHARLTHLLLPLLNRQTAAAIVNISSALSLVPKESAPIYCASKAAMHIFSDSLRYQLEGSSVRVFEVVPALVDTAMTAGRGRGKISPDALVDEALRGIARDKFYIKIGKTKLLFAINRLFPSIAKRIIRRG